MGLENFILNILIFICIYIILSVSLNIALGYTGLLNFGHAAFYGIGAYTSALLALNLGLNFFIAFIFAGLIAGVFGFLLSIPTLKLRGDYLALATIGFGVIFENVMKNWISLTRGPKGLPGIPKPRLFDFVFNDFNDLFFYFVLVFVIMLIIVFLCYRIVNSPFGRVLKAVRDDEIAVSSLGKNVFMYKTIALVVSAVFAGFAGSLYAHYVTFIDPGIFDVLQSVLIVSMVVVGGMASIKGSIIGAVILFLLPEPLRFLHLSDVAIGAVRQVIYSLLLIIIILKRPYGVFGERNVGS